MQMQVQWQQQTKATCLTGSDAHGHCTGQGAAAVARQAADVACRMHALVYTVLNGHVAPLPINLFVRYLSGSHDSVPPSLPTDSATEAAAAEADLSSGRTAPVHPVKGAVPVPMPLSAS